VARPAVHAISGTVVEIAGKSVYEDLSLMDKYAEIDECIGPDINSENLIHFP
jgi:hypothetical protein